MKPGNRKHGAKSCGESRKMRDQKKCLLPRISTICEGFFDSVKGKDFNIMEVMKKNEKVIHIGIRYRGTSR